MKTFTTKFNSDQLHRPLETNPFHCNKNPFKKSISLKSGSPSRIKVKSFKKYVTFPGRKLSFPVDLRDSLTSKLKCLTKENKFTQFPYANKERLPFKSQHVLINSSSLNMIAMKYC